MTPGTERRTSRAMWSTVMNEGVEGMLVQDQRGKEPQGNTDVFGPR